MPKSTLYLLVAFFAASLVAQSTTSKEPWQIPIEERIARRTNPELARERVRVGRRVQTAGAQVKSTASRIVDAFDGKQHPELFLPHEVFDELLKLAYLGSPRRGQIVREGLMPEVRRHGLPTDFWQRLESISTIYIGDSRALYDIGVGSQQDGPSRSRAEQARALKYRDACRSCADALAAARAEFGQEQFDRFLYQVIAVHMHYAADRLPDPKILRKHEGGCR